MEVTCQLTPEDVLALYHRRPWHLRAWDNLRVPLWLCLPLVPGAILWAVLGWWLALAVGWAAIGVLVLVGVIYISRAKFSSVDVSKLGPVTLRLEDDFYAAEGKHARQKCDWSTILSVDETDERIFLFIDTQEFTAHVISKTAFASPEEAAAFAAAARDKAASARTKPRDFSTDEPRWPLTEPAFLSTEQDVQGICVRFQPSASQLAEAHHTALKPAPQTGGVWSWIVIVVCLLLLWSVMSFRGDAAGGQLLIGVGGGFVLLLATFWLMVQWNRWRFQQTVDPRLLKVTALSASVTGLSHHSALSEGFQHWDAFSEIRNNERLIGLYIDAAGKCDYVIPKSAFATEEEAARFIALAEAHIKQQRKPPVDVSPEETDNPYQSPTVRT